MPLAQKLMRPEAERFFQSRRGIRHPIGSAGRKERHVRLFYRKIGIFPQKVRDHALVFHRRERARGVNQPPAGAEHGCGGGQNLQLAVGADGVRVLRPVGDGGLLLAEHPLAGAGGVDENFIKIPREALFQPLRVLVQDQRVGNAQPLDIPRKNFRALGVDLVADQKPLPPEFARQLRRFPAGGRAQVEHALARLRVQKLRRGHGARLLQIIKPRRVIRR